SSRFHNFAIPLHTAHKTGLGSSAALVTAFTAALLTHYLPPSLFSLTNPNPNPNPSLHATSLQRLHNLAQAAHSAAQGKVGSGFDVASAVHGSCQYRRFSPTLLQSPGAAGSPSFSRKLRALVEETDGQVWDTEIGKQAAAAAVRVPRGLRLVMCDVDCGSKTPGMVKTVLRWRAEKPGEAGRIWAGLQRCNEGFAAELVRLAREEEEEEEGAEGQDYAALAKCIAEIRALIREMSEASGVPIEPEQQTQLLDACSKVPGVVGGVVPGAGGYDAIALLVENKPEVIDTLRTVLAGWKVNEEVDSDAVTIGKVSMLGVREEMEGVRLEDPEIYGDWIKSC
ncbi:hypothetical protein AOQ84DRAFT_298996, partial [Glonium stellatum]